MKKEVPTFIKWAGGKKQLLEQFKPFFPSKIERYFEPFVGGGAVAFYIIKNYQPKEVYLSDTNEDLINCYNMIKHNVEELIELLSEYKESHNEETYYKIRAMDPDKLPDIHRAARFIYLNKTCFNGLYRVNSKGRFNVPIGSYKNPAIYSEDELRGVSKMLEDVKLAVMPFQEITNHVKVGDFVYFDPPYHPLNGKQSFTTYTKDNFLEKEQKLLAETFTALNKKGCKVMLSNSDTDFIKNLYGGFKINFVKANRMINSNAAGRGAINEVLVLNYS